MAISTQPAPLPTQPASPSTPPAAPPAAPEDRLWTLSVEQYHEMVRHGIIQADDPVELLDGLLITKMGKNPAHRTAVQLLREALEGSAPAGWHVGIQGPVTLARSEPEGTRPPHREP